MGINTYGHNDYKRTQQPVERHRVTNILLIIGIGAVAVIVVAVVIFVAGAVLTAWTYAKSPQAQMAEELEDNGTIEG